MISILSSFFLESFKLQHAELKRQMISKHFNSRYQVVALEVSIIGSHGQKQCTATSSYGNMKIAPKVFVYWSDRCRRVKIRQFELQSHFGGLVCFPCLNYFNDFSIKAPKTSKSSPGFHEKNVPNFIIIIIITLHSNHLRKKPPLFLGGNGPLFTASRIQTTNEDLESQVGSDWLFLVGFCHHKRRWAAFFWWTSASKLWQVQKKKKVGRKLW